MRAIKLQGQRDRVVGAGIADQEANVWVCTDNGFANSTPVPDYPTQGRGGQGVVTMKLPKESGGLTVATIGWLDDNIVVVTDKGKPKYMRISLAPEAGRNTQGKNVIAMGAKESVWRVVKLEPRIEPVIATSEGEELGQDGEQEMEEE
jgi:DNA gyrase subunit A